MYQLVAVRIAVRLTAFGRLAWPGATLPDIGQLPENPREYFEFPVF